MKRPKTPIRNGVSRRTAMRGLFGCAIGALVSFGARADDAVVRIGYIRSTERHPTISLLDQETPDAGLAGAKLALADDNTTGNLQGQHFDLVDVRARQGADVKALLGQLTGQGIKLVLTDLPAEDVVTLADAGREQGVLIFNLAARDDALRNEQCRGNVFHIVPSRSMFADALAQYLVTKKWTRWLLILGSHPEDEQLAAAYRRAAKRFGARIVQERVDKDTGGSRETDTGLTQTQQQMPVLTQGAPDYDVLVAADENEVFAGYLPYRTWDPRPVAGSAGLEPVTWDPSSESWGGTQLQARFVRMFHRGMTPLDMQAWTAARMVGEAASRTGTVEPDKLIGYMKGPEFGIAAYKGQRLTLRDWDWQLRQPIFLADGRTVVSISPQSGFLHQVTELDTLGFDRPETKCKLQ